MITVDGVSKTYGGFLAVDDVSFVAQPGRVTGFLGPNGAGRHPVYDALVQVADQEGRTGDVRWNFEKFLLDGSGAVVARFDPTVVPDDPRVTAAVESVLG